MATVVDTKEELAIVADEPDNRILESAAQAGSEFIITEDKAMIQQGKMEDVKIFELAEFLDLRSHER